MPSYIFWANDKLAKWKKVKEKRQKCECRKQKKRRKKNSAKVKLRDIKNGEIKRGGKLMVDNRL